MTTRKGVTYYTTLECAREVRDTLRAEGHEEARIVAYELGYAIQYRKSGPYYCERP